MRLHGVVASVYIVNLLMQRSADDHAARQHFVVQIPADGVHIVNFAGWFTQHVLYGDGGLLFGGAHQTFYRERCLLYADAFAVTIGDNVQRHHFYHFYINGQHRYLIE